MSITNEELKIQSGETKLDYHKRIINGKLVDKTLADYDYTELAELVYGQPYSADVARRMFYGSKRTIDTIEEDILSRYTPDDRIDELEQKIVEIRKERKRYSDQRREYYKLVDTDGRIENLYERLEAAADNLNSTVGSLFEDKIELAVSDNEAILVLCDWHYGMVTDNIFNCYNTSVCKERVKKVVADASKRLLLHSCRKLHVLVLGDLVHGAIHFGTRVASEELVCDQIMQVSEILAQAIEELNRHVEETYVYVTYGNHARTIQNKLESTHRDNMERLIPWWLKLRLNKYENIHIVPESKNEIVLLNICGHSGFGTHGDLDIIGKTSSTLASILSQRSGVNIEWAILADKHHRKALDEAGIYSVICGSLAGTDDYANEKRLYSTPSQLLLIVNNECGIDAEYVLKCK